MKECETLGDLSEEGCEHIDEQELSYGPWLELHLFQRCMKNRGRKMQAQGHAVRVTSKCLPVISDATRKRRKNMMRQR